jgi:hypothetical protein
MPSEFWWGFWSDYPKVNLNGREYAKIGERLYTQHAVERFLPSGRRTIGNVPVAQGEGGGFLFHDNARGIAPYFVEQTILHGSKTWTIQEAELRTIHRSGELEVVTTRDDHIVITVGYRH